MQRLSSSKNIYDLINMILINGEQDGYLQRENIEDLLKTCIDFKKHWRR